MMILKKIVILIGLIFVLPLSANPNDILNKFLLNIKGATISFDYTYSMVQNNVEFVGEGSLLSKGRGFKLISDDFDVYCDGKTKWTIEPSAKEVIIENIDSSEVTNVISDNPALILGNINNNFVLESSSINGSEVELMLHPTKEIEGFSYLNLVFLKTQSTLIGAKIVLPDGNTIKISISKFVVSKNKNPDFRFDHISSLSDDYFVTDLR